MKKRYLIPGIVIFLAILSWLLVGLNFHYQQKNWASGGKELFLNNLMENLKAQAKEDAGYVVEHPIVFDELKIEAELKALDDKILKKIKKGSPTTNDHPYNNWKLLSEEDPLASKSFYVSRSANDRMVFIIWERELKIPLSGSIFLTTWEHHGVYGRREFIKALIRIGATEKEATELWKEEINKDALG